MKRNIRKMMHYLHQGKRRALKRSLILYTVILVVATLVIFLFNRFAFKTSEDKIFRICLAVSLLVYFCFVGRSWYSYKYGLKNQTPYYGSGTYIAYYRCSKCRSLHGGIYGEGATKYLINNKKCVHDWQAINKEEFGRRFEELENFIYAHYD